MKYLLEAWAIIIVFLIEMILPGACSLTPPAAMDLHPEPQEIERPADPWEGHPRVPGGPATHPVALAVAPVGIPSLPAPPAASTAPEPVPEATPPVVR